MGEPAPRGDPARYAALLELSRTFSGLLEPDALLAAVMSRTKEALNAQGCSLLLVDEASGELYFPVSRDDAAHAEQRLSEIHFSKELGIAGQVVREGRARHVPDASGDAHFYPEVDAACAR